MNAEVFARLLKLVEPHVKEPELLAGATAETTFLKDLQVSSSRLVDIILAIEDEFGIELTDKEADKIDSLGQAVELIAAKS